MPLSEEHTRAITDALLAGRKIDAIKIYREATGADLKEAKDFIESFSARLELSEEHTRAITDALLAGRKIEAVKIYREATGKGLKEAKGFIESLTAGLREKHPDKFPAAKAGCTSLIVLGLTILTLAGIGGSALLS